MTLSPVVSSNITHIGYDAARRHLYVQFKAAGLYRYADVPLDTVAAFMAADSVGGYFAHYIKGAYKHTRVEDAPAQAAH